MHFLIVSNRNIILCSYREDMQKINVQFHENGTVSFQHKKILEFVPEMSVNTEEKLTVPNIPLLVSKPLKMLQLNIIFF